MRDLLLLLGTTAVFAAAACATAPSDNAPLVFRAQLDEDWKYWMTQYPEVATYLGYPGQNASWTDYSPGAIDARATYLTQSVQRLAGIDRNGLDAAYQLSYDLYRDMLDTAVTGLAFSFDAIPLRSVTPQMLLAPVNQMAGVQVTVLQTIGMMPTETRADYDNIISRLERVGPLVDQTIALMDRGLAVGVTPPRITLRDLPAQIQALILDDPLQSPLLSAFRQWPEAVPAGERDGLTKRAADAYRLSVVPAFRRLHDFLVARYLPGCRESVGARDLPNAFAGGLGGAALYDYSVKWHTTTASTPQQIHETGLAEVKRIRGEMDRVIAATGFKGGFANFLTFLRTNPQFYFTDAPSLLTAYRDIAKRADPELARLFGRLPQNPYGVRAIPDAIAPSQTTAYYEPGTLSVGRPGYMYANTYKLDARPRWEMEALTLHEAVPGHHLQISIAQELQDLPEFRKNASYTAFVEGWGLYAESLGDEMGMYTNPYAKFGQLTYDMWRAVRLVVDTGLHSMGWTRQQAIDYFKANAAKTEQDIIVEVDRYIVWPGQALGYKIGQLKIQELRETAAQKLGDRFDIRGFHDAVLGQGAVPLDALERQVNAWVAQAGS